MRMIYNAVLDREVSALGFGCASLGSRIAPRDGLRSLEYAYDLGVSWYDVAPSYGDGQAEAILGTFVKGRRDRIVLCTKVGIARPTISPVKQLLRRPARWAVRLSPRVRSYISQARSIGARPPLEPKMIRKSVEDSLRLLQTDHLDVLALHEPSVEDCTNPAIIETLQRLQHDGLARAISIAGATTSIAAGLRASPLFAGAQFKDNPFSQNVCDIVRQSEGRELFVVTHSVFDPQAVRGIHLLLRESKTQLGAEASPLRVLFRYALANNPKGTVLLSMFSRDHIAENCAWASEGIDPSIVKKVDGLVAQQSRSMKT